MSKIVQKTDSFTGTTSGATVESDYDSIPLDWALTVVQVGGTATSWTVVLEGSLDGVTFTTILTHANTDGTGVTKWQAAGVKNPCVFYRTRCSAVVLGTATSIKAIVVGTGY